MPTEDMVKFRNNVSSTERDELLMKTLECTDVKKWKTREVETSA